MQNRGRFWSVRGLAALLFLAAGLALSVGVARAGGQPAPESSAVSAPSANPASSPSSSAAPVQGDVAPQNSAETQVRPSSPGTGGVSASETSSGSEGASDSSDAGEKDTPRAQRVYQDPDVPNLSRLYWALGMFDIEKDDLAVDNYIMINECQIFRDYFTDDFEWKNVREATRSFLRKNMKSFSRRFEFIQPIELGRYNEDTQTFEVLTDLITKGSRLLYGDMNSRNEQICDKRGNIDGYPRNVIVSLSRPIHYPQIPVNVDLARDYIARTKIRNEEDFRNSPEHLMTVLKMKSYERLAFIVVKVRMIKFIEMRNARDGSYPVIFAALEGIEIYEDPKKKRLLYSSLSRTKSPQ